MKGKRRLFTTACLAALLAAAAVMPAAAAKRGWEQEGDRWVYLDADGLRITSSWVKGKDSQWYYLDEEGYMAANAFVRTGEDIYYVDENGIRVKNKWISQPNDSLCEQDVKTLWYYFGDDCKAVTDGIKGITLHSDGEDRTYYFDHEGHMLSGWQRIPEREGSSTFYNFYLGTEDEGYAHKMWQYLEPEDSVMTDGSKEYESPEMFYFGWKERMSTGETEIDGSWYWFNDNGSMLRGWEPGIVIEGGHVGINKYYDEVTGKRVSGWLYAYGVENEKSEPYWFYLDEKDGIPYNEGSKDSDDVLGMKVIDGATYFFDERGRMITGLISTGGEGVGAVDHIVEKYKDLEGNIGKGKSRKLAGIYYLSDNDRNLGQLQKNVRLNMGNEDEPCYYYFDATGRAYERALVDGRIYGDGGVMIHGELGMELITIHFPVYEPKDYERGELKDSAVPVILEGSPILIDKSGRVKKNGTVKVGDLVYEVKDYIAMAKE